jgi:hypothetical protein
LESSYSIAQLILATITRDICSEPSKEQYSCLWVPGRSPSTSRLSPFDYASTRQFSLREPHETQHITATVCGRIVGPYHIRPPLMENGLEDFIFLPDKSLRHCTIGKDAFETRGRRDRRAHRQYQQHRTHLQEQHHPPSMTRQHCRKSIIRTS